MQLFTEDRWAILNTDEIDHCIRYTVEKWKKPIQCLKCGNMVPQLVRFGIRKSTYVDLPMSGKRVVLLVQRQRYQCGDCGKVFLQDMPELNDDHRMTNRAVDYIRENSMARTHSEIARELGVDVKTVWNVFIEWAREKDKEYKVQTPAVLGIDEIFALKRSRCVLTNIRESTVVHVLENRNMETVKMWLNKLPDRYRVEVIAMDMWEPYRLAVQPLFPKVPIVIDKFHVVRLANQGLDSYRKSLKENLKPAERRRLKKDRYLLLRRYDDLTPSDRIIFESWIGRFDLLKQAHLLKENFFKIYDCQNRADADKQYDEWLKSVPEDLLGHFRPLLTATRNWHTEIFNYFDIQPRVTNAFTESLNNLIGHLITDGRGYSFPVLRAKIMFTKRKELPLARRSFDMADAAAAAHANREDFGADLSTLFAEYGIVTQNG
jgi:transposase